jgi:hypothetical protein
MPTHHYRSLWRELLFAIFVELVAAIILLLIAKALETIPVLDGLITHPLTIAFVAVVFWVVGALFVRRAIQIGPPAEVTALPSYAERSFWDRIFSPQAVAFVSTALLISLFSLMFIPRDLRFFVFLFLLVANSVREFTKDYYLHREAFDKLMAQTLLLLDVRCRQGCEVTGVSRYDMRYCVYLHDGKGTLMPHWSLGMKNDVDQKLVLNKYQGTVGRAFRMKEEKFDERPADLIGEWAYTEEQEEMARKDIVWEYSVPLLGEEPGDEPLGVLRIDSNLDLEPEKGGDEALGRIRSAALEYTDQIALQLIIGPIRGQAGQRLI